MKSTNPITASLTVQYEAPKIRPEFAKQIQTLCGKFTHVFTVGEWRSSKQVTFTTQKIEHKKKMARTHSIGKNVQFKTPDQALLDIDIRLNLESPNSTLSSIVSAYVVAHFAQGLSMPQNQISTSLRF